MRYDDKDGDGGTLLRRRHMPSSVVSSFLYLMDSTWSSGRGRLML